MLQNSFTDAQEFTHEKIQEAADSLDVQPEEVQDTQGFLGKFSEKQAQK